MDNFVQINQKLGAICLVQEVDDKTIPSAPGMTKLFQVIHQDCGTRQTNTLQKLCLEDGLIVVGHLSRSRISPQDFIENHANGRGWVGLGVRPARATMVDQNSF